MRLCPTLILKRVFENFYSMIRRQNKTKVCKHNLSYLNDFSKFLYLRLVTETKIVIDEKSDLHDGNLQ